MNMFLSGATPIFTLSRGADIGIGLSLWYLGLAIRIQGCRGGSSGHWPGSRAHGRFWIGFFNLRSSAVLSQSSFLAFEGTRYERLHAPVRSEWPS